LNVHQLPQLLPVLKRNQSSLLARDIDAVGNDGHGTGKATAFIYDSKQPYTTPSNFVLQFFSYFGTFDLGRKAAG
jgi:hypothetical protein